MRSRTRSWLATSASTCASVSAVACAQCRCISRTLARCQASRSHLRSAASARPLADLGRGQQAMAQRLQRRELVAARLRAALRHHRRQVPVQHRLRVAQRADPAEAGPSSAAGTRSWPCRFSSSHEPRASQWIARPDRAAAPRRSGTDRESRRRTDRAPSGHPCRGRRAARVPAYRAPRPAAHRP